MTLHADATRCDQIDIDDHSVDLCLMATVLHDFEEANQTGPVLELIQNLVKPHGYLAVIEFKKIEGPPGPPARIRLSADEVDKRVTEYGFKHIKTVELGDYTYLMTFKSMG
jgi:ubiquinone/menaquinone biosynthesis C-methylase UbiE